MGIADSGASNDGVADDGAAYDALYRRYCIAIFISYNVISHNADLIRLSKVSLIDCGHVMLRSY